MSEHAATNKLVVSGEEDFCHDVAVVSKVLEGILCSQIIKAVGLWLPFLIDVTKGMVAVLLYYRITFLDEIKGYGTA